MRKNKIRRFRYFEEKFFKVLMIISLIAIPLLTLSMITTIFIRGHKVLTWEMVSSLPGGGFYIGKEGGFLNAIVGSIYITGASALLGLLVSIPVVFYINIWLKETSRFAKWVRTIFDVLFGVPSIVYGAFGFTIMIYFGLKASLGGGIIAITLLIIPIFIRSMDEVAVRVPKDILTAAYSLGATKTEVMFVVLRQIAPGIATATLLSIGRAIGDAAAVMFTAGFSDNIPTSFSQAAATLPLSIFFQLGAPQAAVQDRAYAAAVVLTVIVLVLSISGRIISSKFSKHKV